MSGRTPKNPELKPGTKTTPRKAQPLSSVSPAQGTSLDKNAVREVLGVRVTPKQQLAELRKSRTASRTKSAGPAGAGASSSSALSSRSRTPGASASSAEDVEMRDDAGASAAMDEDTEDGAGAPPPPPTSGGEDDAAGSKFLVHQIFGPDVGNAMALAAGYGKKYDFRGVFEPVDASAQCKAVMNEFPPNGDPCYLCGLRIPSKAELGNNSAHELYPECEHVLPVTEARLYLDLYMGPGRVRRLEEEPLSVQQNADEWRNYALDIEYGWAHRVCNQAKTNDSFVKSNGQGGLAPSDKGFLTILSNIRKRATKHATSGAYGEYSATFTAIANTIIGRKTAILNERILPIIETVNNVNAQQSPGVMMLARTAAVVDPSNMLPGVVQAMQEAENNEGAIKARIARFVTEFLTEYPRFASPALERSILDTLQRSYPDVFKEEDLSFVRENVHRSLERYFMTIVLTPKAQRRSASDAASVLSNVIYYGIYLDLMTNVSTSPQPRFTDQVLVGLYDQLSALFEPIEGDPTSSERIRTLRLVFGDPPPTPPRVDKGRADRARDERMQKRKMGVRTPAEVLEDNAAAETAQEMAEEEAPILVDDALAYYFADLPDTLWKNGVPEDEIPGIVHTIYDAYRDAFNPDDPRGAFESAIGAAGFGADISTILRSLGNEDFIDEDERQRMVTEAARTPEGNRFVPSGSGSGAPPPGTRGAGSGAEQMDTSAGGGKRNPKRRPLYG